MSDDLEPMTGRALRDFLNTLTDEQLDTEVVTEGCDCDGEAGAVTIDQRQIYIHRIGGDYEPPTAQDVHWNWQTSWPHALPDVTEVSNTTDDPAAVTCQACTWAMGSQKNAMPPRAD